MAHTMPFLLCVKYDFLKNGGKCMDNMQNSYRNAIRKHVDQMIKLGNKNNLVIYRIRNDEEFDPTFVSLRAYSTPIYADVVMVCCGVSAIWESLPVGDKVGLPTANNIAILRREWGITQ